VLGSATRRFGFAGLGALFLVLVSGAAPAAGATVFNVSNTNDVAALNAASGSCATPPASPAGGACTLRSAVQAAHNTAGSSTINVAAGTYKLTIAPTGADDDSSGDLNVTGTLTITGAGSGAGGTIVDGNFTDRVFDITSGADVAISDLTVQHGRAGLGSSTTCPATNQPEADGGGIRTAAPLTLTRVTVTGNGAVGGGGGILDTASNPATLALSRTTVSHNFTCQPSGFGSSRGGGLSREGSGRVTIDLSTIDSNTAFSGDGGGVAARGNAALVMTITNTAITRNHAADGGGIAAQGGGAGGGVHLFADLVSGNIADGSAGGIETGGDNVIVVNSTITQNMAGQTGGGFASGLGSTQISFSTVWANSAPQIANEDSGDYTLDDSIVAGAGGGNCLFTSSAGNNLFDDSTECGAVASDLVTPNVKLGPLQDNGGPTLTEALPFGSPAIDTANDQTCSATATSVDQRAVKRPQGPHCDIGAFEFQAADLALTKTASPRTVDLGQRLAYTLGVTNKGPSTATGVVVTDGLPSFVTLVSAHPSQGTCSGHASLNCALGTLAVNGHASIRVVVRARRAGRFTNTAHVKGGVFDPDLRNNSASAAARARCRGDVIRVSYDNDDPLVEVRVYLDGHRVRWVRGSHVSRRVAVPRVSEHGAHEIKVFARLSDHRRVTVTRSYRGCTHGSTHLEVLPTSGVTKEP
jgi:uncharacterized repeat protein (TIGR01451 family)